MGDQRLVVGLLSANDCDLGASDDERRLQRFDIVCSASGPALMMPMES